MCARVIHFSRPQEPQAPAAPAAPKRPAPRPRASAVATEEATDEDSSMVARQPAKAATVAIRKPGKPGNGYRKRGTVTEEMRKSLLAKIHVAKKQLGLTDDEYRAMLEGNFGVSSAAHLDGVGLQRMIFEMQAYGFQPRRGHARRGENRRRAVPATLASDDSGLGRKKLMEKIEAQLAEKGREEGTDVPWAYAVGILQKQSGGVTRCLEHATPEQLRGVIAALARDARRHGRRVN